MSDIVITGAKMHNLKGIDVTIPRNSLTVVTGLSGSGKSTLAFDTLYAEGQRRYVESLSAYARQFLDRLAKPDVEKIEGLSPAISIEQHTTSGNPRSIVATVTEIHDYLRILYGSVATPHCPKCGRPVTRQSAEQIVEAIGKLSNRRIVESVGGKSSNCQIVESVGGKSSNRQIVESSNGGCAASRPIDFQQVSGCGVSLHEQECSGAAGAASADSTIRRFDDSTIQKILLLAPVVKGKKGRHEEVFATLRRNGFVRVKVDGETHLLEEVPELDKKKAHDIDVVVDRLVLPCVESAESQTTETQRSATAFRTRLTDSVELALKTGQGVMKVEVIGKSSNRRIVESVGGKSSNRRIVESVGGKSSNRQIVESSNGGRAASRPIDFQQVSGSGVSLHEQECSGAAGAASADSTIRRFDDSTIVFSELNACVHCGISFDELKPRSFSFNSPFGACPKCGGLGQLYYFDEDLVVPDKTLPLRECIHPWRRAGHNAIMYYNALLEQIAKQYKVKLSTPWEKLPAKFRHDMMHGFKEDLVLPWRSVDRPFEGVLPMLQRYIDEAEDDETRAKWEPYQSYRTCPDCHGARLNEFSRTATVAGKTIGEVMALPVGEARAFFAGLSSGAGGSSGSSASSGASASRMAGLRDILSEIVKRLQFLLDVGLDYLTLDRASSTLSGGEMQRIRLATQIGSGLTGVLYVLDEPTIGLHPRDNERLIKTLKELRDRGNTVVIVEHDEEMMRAADWIVDLGPGAGREGGRLMYQGDFKGLLKAKSLTAEYLRGEKSIVESSNCRNRRVVGSLPSAPVKKHDGERGDTSSIRRFDDSDNSKNSPCLTLSGACEHNLKNVTVHIPVGSFTVVTGVSGSGKSTLIDETLKRALMKQFYGSKEVPGKYKKLTGLEHFDKVIEIDQSPIGRTPRSNPATYVGFFSEIRQLFAETQAAKARGYTAGRFSFNVKGGRCEVCGGDGVQKLEMSFLPDVYVTCEQCGGKRFNAETLEVTYGGKNIAEVLEMTVAEAYEFFAKVPSLARKLKTLVDVGLGYVALGQAATTLSGGEAQRIKLATELSKRSTGKTLYFLDEPTTGLHFDDVAKLMKILLQLRDQGNTVVIIEHNVDVMRCADWIIDLGPGGGDKGGMLVCEGPVPKIRACKNSVTGKFL